MKKTTAAILMMLGLALAGFGAAGYAARSATSAVAAATTTTLCSRAHPCSDPGCKDAGFGVDDCFATTTGGTTTTGSTTTATTATTTTGSTSTATTPTGSTSTATTTNVATTTTSASTTTGSFLPPPTTTVGTTTSSSPTTAGTTTAVVSPGKAGSFRPPKVPRPRPPLTKGATELPFTGAATPATVLIGFGILGLGLLLLVLGRDGRAIMPGSSTPRATVQNGRATQTGGSTAARAVRRSLGYRVFVPGRGNFASVADAEQPLLDHRWARAGCPRLGAPGRRRPSDDV